jgi:hypothetical protein
LHTSTDFIRCARSAFLMLCSAFLMLASPYVTKDLNPNR